PGVRALLIRESLGDWSAQLPLQIAIRRLGAPTAEPPSQAALVERAVTLLSQYTDVLVNFQTRFNPFPTNSLSKPLARPGGWGFVATGNFKLASDEALLVSLDSLDSRYFAIMLTTPWLTSLPHVHATGSFNLSQSQRSADGSFTYVISARDPKVHNWLDTGGLQDGTLTVRWQAPSPAAATRADSAVKSIKVVKLADLKTVLPNGTATVEPQARERLVELRAASYARRCGVTCEVDDTVLRK
ncbi:MAG: hypothetical protein ABW034_11750, partial [Steroidobacteraceae bacterium]